MSTVNVKYLKDEDGNIISPVTSVDSVYTKNGTAILDYVLPLSGGSLTGNLSVVNIYAESGYASSIGTLSSPFGACYVTCIEIMGLTYPYIDFHYNKSSSDYTSRIIENESGTLTVYNNIVNGSDKRLKNNIEDIDDKYLELFDKLDIKTYNFTNSNTLDCGIIAQDVLDLEDELGIEDSILVRGTGEEKEIGGKTQTDYYTLNYNNLTAMCVKKIQQLEKRIEELEGRIEELENK